MNRTGSDLAMLYCKALLWSVVLPLLSAAALIGVPHRYNPSCSTGTKHRRCIESSTSLKCATGCVITGPHPVYWTWLARTEPLAGVTTSVTMTSTVVYIVNTIQTTTSKSTFIPSDNSNSMNEQGTRRGIITYSSSQVSFSSVL